MPIDTLDPNDLKKTKDFMPTLTEMAEAAKTHDLSFVTKNGDGQHADDILWYLGNEKEELYSGSIPMTSHTRGAGNKNLTPAAADLNKAIKYLNGLG